MRQSTRRGFLFGAVSLIPGTMLSKSRKKKRRQRRKDGATIVVSDFTDPAWGGIISASVDNFNAVMPASGPLLVYERREPGVCPEDITVCTGNTDEYLGLTWHSSEHGFILLSNNNPIPTEQGKMAIACHEMMHALTGIFDCYGCQVDSCVHGWMEKPGDYDIQYLARYFKKKRKRRKKR